MHSNKLVQSLKTMFYRTNEPVKCVPLDFKWYGLNWPIRSRKLTLLSNRPLYHSIILWKILGALNLLYLTYLQYVMICKSQSLLSKYYALGIMDGSHALQTWAVQFWLVLQHVNSLLDYLMSKSIFLSFLFFFHMQAIIVTSNTNNLNTTSKYSYLIIMIYLHSHYFKYSYLISIIFKSPEFLNYSYHLII